MNQRLFLSWIGFLLFLVFLGYSLVKKERIRKEGRLVYFSLLPQDPRSLFQGDYMDLRYSLASEWESAKEKAPKQGILVFQIKEGIAVAPVQFLTHSETAFSPGQGCLHYYAHGESIRFGAEQYFFQEGEAPLLNGSVFAGLAISETCEGVLVGLYNSKKERLGLQ